VVLARVRSIVAKCSVPKRTNDMSWDLFFTFLAQAVVSALTLFLISAIGIGIYKGEREKHKK